MKLVGGAVIIWIAFKLMIMQAEGGEETHGKTAGNLWQALWIIIVADMSMAIDNMLAVGGACHGNLFLLLFGLILSIPLVVCGAGLLSMLMGKYPIIVWIGAAILGKVGGEMMITDPWIEGLLHPSKAVEYGVDDLLHRRCPGVLQDPSQQEEGCQGGGGGTGRRAGGLGYWLASARNATCDTSCGFCESGFRTLKSGMQYEPRKGGSRKGSPFFSSDKMLARAGDAMGRKSKSEPQNIEHRISKVEGKNRFCHTS